MIYIIYYTKMDAPIKQTYYQRNKEKLKQQANEYYHANKDRYKQRYEAKREDIAAYHREYQQRNREAARRNQKAYRERLKAKEAVVE